MGSSRPRWTDFHKIWRGCRGPWRNHSLTFWLQYFQGFQIYRVSKFLYSHRLCWSSLQQCWRYRAACDIFIRLLCFTGRLRVRLFAFWNSNQVMSVLWYLWVVKFPEIYCNLSGILRKINASNTVDRDGEQSPTNAVVDLRRPHYAGRDGHNALKQLGRFPCRTDR